MQGTFWDRAWALLRMAWGCWFGFSAVGCGGGSESPTPGLSDGGTGEYDASAPTPKDAGLPVWGEDAGLGDASPPAADACAAFEGGCEDTCPDDPDKSQPGRCGCGVPDEGAGSCESEQQDAGTPPMEGCEVVPVPDSLRRERNLDPFYQKYADAAGIPILTSMEPDDRALVLACQLVLEMVSERDDVRQALIRNKAHFTIIGINEKTTDTPEYSHLPDYYNTRARGLGGLVGSCAEESIFCDRARDRWYGESICVHEFAHTISLYGLYSADRTFEARLNEAYNAAKQAGRFQSTYFMENPQEYWAEGVQNYYNTNLESSRPNGVHGPIDTRDELKSYDPTLYALIEELLPDEVAWADCYRKQ